MSSSSSINFRLGLLILKLRRQYNVNDFTAQKSIELPTRTPIALKYFRTIIGNLPSDRYGLAMEGMVNLLVQNLP